MRKIFFIVLLVVIIIVILILFFLFSTTNKRAPDRTAVPTITSVPIKAFVSLPPKNNVPFFEKTKLIEQLPIETKEYNIEYLVESDTFVVTIKESPYLGNKQKTNQFFIANGISDLSQLRIVYNSYRWVQ